MPLNIVVTYGMKQQYISLVLSLNAHIRKQGSRGKQREAEGSRGKQREEEERLNPDQLEDDQQHVPPG